MNTRIAVKTIQNAIAENFQCPGNSMPNSTFLVDGNDVSISGDYSIPLETIKRANGAEWWHGLEYDILIDWQSQDQGAAYDIDVEVSSDFLTGQVTFKLLYERKPGKYAPYASGFTEANVDKQGPFLQRLKMPLNSAEVIKNADFSHAILRLEIPATSLKQMVAVEDSGLLTPSSPDLCVNFGLWFRAVRTDTQQASNPFSMKAAPTLMRVRWEGYKVQNG